MNHDYYDEGIRQMLKRPDARPKDSGESTLAEADRLINGDRQVSYSHPLDNFTNIGRLWGAFLLNAIDKSGLKLVTKEGWTVDLLALEPEEVALMMDQLKVAREQSNPKRDNRVDGPGYWGCLELIHQEKERRNGCG